MPPLTNNKDSKKFKILQINLNHCRMAQDLIAHAATQYEADIVIIAEPWSPLSSWFNDGHKNSSIWIPQGTQGVFNNIRSIYTGKGIVAVQLDTYIVTACYFSPNITTEAYEDRISELERFLGTVDVSRCIIAGDLMQNPLHGALHHWTLMEV
ncbi:uncharacterized protein LOC143219888 [Lasioglossum baleicum]|uniref:uncharacterized protein LOC143219888 n=1 Tax=Lasioglossum baleicum TaxID=434251 RepID=UPI003FCD40A7